MKLLRNGHRHNVFAIKGSDNVNFVGSKGPRESRKIYEYREITEKFEVNPDLRNRKNSGFVIDANHEPVSVTEVKKSFPRTLKHKQEQQKIQN